MFESNSQSSRRRRGRGAALLACVLAIAGLGLVAVAQPASAGPPVPCDVFLERCQQLPTFIMDPSGALDAPSFGATSVRVTGWASDPSTRASIDVIVSVGG